MSTKTLYVMTDPGFGPEAYVTTWEDFKSDCEAQGWDANDADMPELDEFLKKVERTGISKRMSAILLDGADRYGIEIDLSKIQVWP